jgi:hypothetical protein
MRPLSTLNPGGILTAGLLVCATASAAPPSQHLTLRTPDYAVTATVSEDGIQSPDLQLYVSKDALRGRAYGEVVNLSIDEDTVGGLVGALPTRLELSPRKGGGLEVTGTLGGDLTRFTLSPQKLSGTVGDCSYELRFTGSRYEGHRSCGGRIENPVFLELPATLAQAGNGPVVATLGLILDSP